ncbi:MAG: hypothetical protein ACREJ2_16105 [Planctomycetota bacterium]
MIRTQTSSRAAAGVALAALLLFGLTGCAAPLFGRPQSYDDLASEVADAFTHDHYENLRDLVVTNADMRKMGESADGPDDDPYKPAEIAVHDSFDRVLTQGKAAGIDWEQAHYSSAIARDAKHEYKEKVDVELSLDQQGNRYKLLIKNAQLINDGDIVLTGPIEWLGTP